MNQETITASLDDINAALTIYVYCRDTISKARHPDKDRKLLKPEAVKMLDSCISALREAVQKIEASNQAESDATKSEAQ